MAAKPVGTRIKTTNALLDGYRSLSVEQFLAPLADDFHHHVLPESLSMAVRNRDSFAEHAHGIFAIFSKFQMDPINMYEDAESGVVFLHARMLGMLKGGGGKWTNECIMLIKFNEAGEKISEIKEFVDSAKALEMMKQHAPENFGTDSPSVKEELVSA